MRRLLMICLPVLAGLTMLCGCGSSEGASSSEDAFVGVWIGTVLGMDFALDVKEDGTARLIGENFTWIERAPTQIELTKEDGSKWYFTLLSDGEHAEWAPAKDGIEMIMERQ